jgi:hypothetical protein
MSKVYKMMFEIEIHFACKLYVFLYVRRSGEPATLRLLFSGIQVALNFMPAIPFYLQQ